MDVQVHPCCWSPSVVNQGEEGKEGNIPKDCQNHHRLRGKLLDRGNNAANLGSQVTSKGCPSLLLLLVSHGSRLTKENEKKTTAYSQHNKHFFAASSERDEFVWASHYEHTLPDLNRTTPVKLAMLYKRLVTETTSTYVISTNRTLGIVFCNKDISK